MQSSANSVFILNKRIGKKQKRINDFFDQQRFEVRAAYFNE